MSSSSASKLTAEEYLALDRAAEFRSEFFDGDMVAKSGVSLRHDGILMNLIGDLASSVRDRGCELFGSRVRVRVSSRMYVYPDLSIVCGKILAGDEMQDILLNPAILFEILSPSTENYDRGPKLQHYRGIDSLNEYILIDQNQARIEH